MKYFQTSERTSHTISQNNNLHNMPGNSNRQGKESGAADLKPRCASCGRGRKR